MARDITEQPHWQVYGTSTLGERGQLVIPADARREFDLGTGNRFVVVGLPEFGTIGLVKADVFGKLADGFLSQASTFARYAQNTEGVNADAAVE
jgi:bifunctional DNA-binding transcriptional regulator/antitoxin component of YhaV-PrlF toxin-antitoxin module